MTNMFVSDTVEPSSSGKEAGDSVLAFMKSQGYSLLIVFPPSWLTLNKNRRKRSAGATVNHLSGAYQRT